MKSNKKIFKMNKFIKAIAIVAIACFVLDETILNFNLIQATLVRLDSTNNNNSTIRLLPKNQQQQQQTSPTSSSDNQHKLSSKLPLVHYRLSNKKSQDNLLNKNDSFIIEKICIGTSNRLSAQDNKTDHYHNLVERYKNCTYVMGNLEITWLDANNQIDGQPIDLSFLESIREITGYLLIAYVDVEKIRMPNLQIIRGRDLFSLNNAPNDEFAMFLMENKLKSLELPNLREILAGDFGSHNNSNLCYINTINWGEILNTPSYASKFVIDANQPECPACDPSCADSCWGPGPEMCQKFSKTNCSPQCSQSRCFGSLPRECCHSFCAGGCTGPKQTDCLACKYFQDGKECIQECPSMQKYNPTLFLWETNPNGKYAFGAKCVKDCPEHLLRDNGACVRTCPPNKRPGAHGECVQCVGPCQKQCQGVDVVHSGNIDQLVNCTTIEGSLTILDTSFAGYAEVHNNNTIGTRYSPMHPDRLEALKNIKEITGFLSIQAYHRDFRDLSYFRNLNTIGGRTTTDMFNALSIIKTSLVSLNLRSLKKIRSGGVLIEDNKDLCFAKTVDWDQVNVTKREAIKIDNNAPQSKCQQLKLGCHEQCADHCWGPNADECMSCKNYKLDDYCVENCQQKELKTLNLLAYDSGNKTCKKCHPECKDGCSGIEAKHCTSCKNVKDGPYCQPECPSHKYNNNGNCEECDKSCTGGCTGPMNKLGKGGCNSCGKAIINSLVDNATTTTSVAYCIKADEPCPEGYYQEYVRSQSDHGPLKLSSGKPVCRKCHHRCKSCIGMGTHTSVCECAKYVAGEQCEDSCPRDYFADDNLGKCIKCSQECNSCFGPTEADCISCRVYRIYYESASTVASTTTAFITQSNQHEQLSDKLNQLQQSNNHPDSINNNQVKAQIKFNCTAQCPPDKPYRISESNMLDPYCSEDPGSDIENPRIVSMGTSTSIIFFLIFISVSFMVCVFIYRCQIEKDKTVKLTMHLSGIDDVEPLTPSNLKPNLAPLRSIKETELRKGNILGSGHGGTVYQGFWYPEGSEDKKPRPVAIKVLRDHEKTNKNREFLEEAYIMASVNHPNLVRLLAVCMTPNHLMLVTQLMPLGCLLGYVKKYKNEIGSKNLLEWCKQIAKGMAYLEEHRMVHRDLALRNVLLQTCGRALISDFGLAKFLELDQSEYSHSGEGKLAIKWLAPECIRKRKFTHKSDVWAFGVTIWELFTFGQRPFEEYDTRDVPLAIEKGARLKQPSYMSAEVYKVMYACWFYEPDERPNFSTLEQNFIKFARDPERYLICGTKGIEYTPSNCGGNKLLRQKVHHFSKSSQDSCDDYSDDVNSVATDDEPTSPVMTDSTINNRNNDSRFGFDIAAKQHNSESEKSEQPTDMEDYLMPSPCDSNNNEFEFRELNARLDVNRLATAQANHRHVPYSAGLIEISNTEYFLTQTNYVNSRLEKRNASSGHLPHSLV